MTSIANESVLSDELNEETKEFKDELKTNNLTLSIHMPNLNQLDESKLSFHNKQFNENSNSSQLLIRENLSSETPGVEAFNSQKLNSDFERKENYSYRGMPDNKQEPQTLSPHQHTEFNKINAINNNSLWTDNSIAVKSHTNINSSPNEKLNHRANAPISADFEFKTPNNYFQGQPITSVGYTYQINPSTNSEFSYLNRNKLVNRRLTIKKQLDCSQGLPSIGRTGVDLSINVTADKHSARLVSDFALGSEKMLNELKQYNDLIEDTKILENFTPDMFGYYKNISSNAVDNIKPKSGKNRRKQGFRPAKSSSIIILEREKSLIPFEEPSPASYHIPRRPLNEKKSPMFTIGKRCFNEKGGGGRTSWEKEWFNSNNPFIIKSDFRRELFWPTPTNYRIKSSIGIESNKSLFYQYPNHSIAQGPRGSAKHLGSAQPLTAPEPIRNSHCNGCQQQGVVLSRDDLIEKDMKKYNVNKGFNLNDPMSARDQLQLDVISSSIYTCKTAPKVGFKFRERGTELWVNKEETPGPGTYDHNKFQSISRFTKKTPNFSIAQAKHNVNYNIGPFAAL